jgi:hypothetical protein
MVRLCVAEVFTLQIGIRVPEPPGRRPKSGGRGEHLRQRLEWIMQRRMKVPRRDAHRLGSSRRSDRHRHPGDEALNSSPRDLWSQELSHLVYLPLFFTLYT